ncbi:hypothetical protein H6P81_021373 [Aristolochia fimbriata]|uniref:Uncharacterized protein n=1 Tax=Aristolochia fimbriata TaxID=158543 RepID=A0AAV7DRR4_ARIFI|nr:hypothetical protein H6P81_021373 [Aristolochia fimbriata]
MEQCRQGKSAKWIRNFEKRIGSEGWARGPSPNPPGCRWTARSVPAGRELVAASGGRIGNAPLGPSPANSRLRTAPCRTDSSPPPARTVGPKHIKENKNVEPGGVPHWGAESRSSASPQATCGTREPASESPQGTGRPWGQERAGSWRRRRPGQGPTQGRRGQRAPRHAKESGGTRDAAKAKVGTDCGGRGRRVASRRRGRVSLGLLAPACSGKACRPSARLGRACCPPARSVQWLAPQRVSSAKAICPSLPLGDGLQLFSRAGGRPKRPARPFAQLEFFLIFHASAGPFGAPSPDLDLPVRRLWRLCWLAMHGPGIGAADRGAREWCTLDMREWCFRSDEPPPRRYRLPFTARTSRGLVGSLAFPWCLCVFFPKGAARLDV